MLFTICILVLVVLVYTFLVNVKKLLELSDVKDFGHPLSKHLNISDVDLEKRVLDNIEKIKNTGKSAKWSESVLKNNLNKINASTKFHDRATMEKAVRDAFASPEGQKVLKNVKNLSKGMVKGKSFEQPFVVKNIGSDLGYGYKVIGGVSSKINKITDIEIFLKADGKGGFYISSAFPKL